ncbi:MAG TPA: carboxyl transferase domain-containing protein [Desulfobacteraceae bacterium]|nr:carboxyl transferase domain-containing protein [Desulfobacteraceae bacterium]HPJ68219.1 carboxyl transferase domain-containing protein [Desulfobacteraceae bacterium]HPQ28853.1 carboxyl transferase domain-containing protein [Desulfobacteraceae bacterium]
MNWKDEVEELFKRKEFAYGMGGEKNVKKQHDQGKMTARERIEAFLDSGSFLERGILSGEATYEKNELVGFTPCPILIGLGKVNGQRISLLADDFTIKGASVGDIYKGKLAYVMKMARELKIPMVRLLDGAGGTIKEILKFGYVKFPTLPDYAMKDLVNIMSMVPVVSVALGPTAGSGGLLMVSSHFSVMVKGLSQVFTGGPALSKQAFGERVTKEELGDYKIHTRKSGVVDNEAESEKDAFRQIKTFLSYMPPNVWELPKRNHQEQDDPNRREEELLSAIPRNPRKAYNIKYILELIFDRNSLFEIGQNYGKAQITALARLNGYPVGVLANNSTYWGGSFGWDVAEKFQRFVDMCDTFHLPIVNFVDQPGFRIGKDAEIQGTIRKGVRAVFSVYQATVPYVAIYIRKAYGVAGGSQEDYSGLNWRYFWPSANWGNIVVEGGVYAAHKAEIEASSDPEALLDELEEQYRNFASPFRSAEAFDIEDVIDPRDTRPLLCDWVEMGYSVEKKQLGIKSRGIRC